MAVLLSLAGGLSVAVKMPAGDPKLQVLGPLGILETSLIGVKKCLLHACTTAKETVQEKHYGVASRAASLLRHESKTPHREAVLTRGQACTRNQESP